MKVFFSSQAAQKFCRKGCTLTIGNYDGLHAGHRILIKHLRQQAGRKHLPALVYTFEPHPVRLLAPHVAPPLLNTLQQKIELIGQTGVDALIVEKFDRTFSKTSPETFFEKYLVERLNTRFVIVGYDFTFGAKRHGNIETLERLGQLYKIDVKILEPFFARDTLVSSSLVRRYIQEGNVEEVIPSLGRPYFIEGKVVRGTGRGTKLSIPTVNLAPENEIIPKSGVYATQVVFNGKRYGAITNIGNRPTFGAGPVTIETHLFRFHQKIYGQKIRVAFLNRIRDEIRFDHTDQLVRQIQIDIVKAKRLYKKQGPP